MTRVESESESGSAPAALRCASQLLQMSAVNPGPRFCAILHDVGRRFVSQPVGTSGWISVHRYPFATLLVAPNPSLDRCSAYAPMLAHVGVAPNGWPAFSVLLERPTRRLSRCGHRVVGHHRLPAHRERLDGCSRCRQVSRARRPALRRGGPARDRRAHDGRART